MPANTRFPSNSFHIFLTQDAVFLPKRCQNLESIIVRTLFLSLGQISIIKQFKIKYEILSFVWITKKPRQISLQLNFNIRARLILMSFDWIIWIRRIVWTQRYYFTTTINSNACDTYINKNNLNACDDLWLLIFILTQITIHDIIRLLFSFTHLFIAK